MPGSSTILPSFSSGADAGIGARMLKGTGRFGETAALAREVLQRTGIVMVVGAGWDPETDAIKRLAGTLESHPSAAFAFGAWCELPGRHGSPTGSGAVAIDAAILISRPEDLGPLAVRASEAARLGWPDFGPPDSVLDGAATWALAAALAARGGAGLFVPEAITGRPVDPPGSIDRLRPEGAAWLVSSALTWGPGGHPSPDLAERLWRHWTQGLAAAGLSGLTPPGTDGR